MREIFGFFRQKVESPAPVSTQQETTPTTSPLDERLLEDFGDYGVIKGISRGRVFYEALESQQSSEKPE